jgi:hypothetical protein
LGRSTPLDSSLACGLGARFDQIDQSEDVVAGAEYFLPNEFLCVGGGSCVAATAADKCLAIIGRGSLNLAPGMLAKEDFDGCDLGFAVDGSQRVDVPRGSKI